MSNLHPVEAKTREYIDQLSILTGLPYDTVSKVIDGMRLMTLHDLFKQGLEHKEEGMMGEWSPEIILPRMTTVVLMPVHRTKDAPDFEGYTFKGKVYFMEKFLQECKKSYYLGQDPLLDHTKEVFSNELVEKYKSIL